MAVQARAGPYMAELSELLGSVEAGRVRSTAATLAGLLRSCVRFCLLPELRRVHRQIAAAPTPALEVQLVQAYLSCGSLDEARAAFDSMASTKPGLALWTSLISAYAKTGHYEAAMQAFQDMQCRRIAPDKVAFVAVLGSLRSHQQLNQARLIRSRIQECGFDQYLVVSNALVTALGSCGAVQDARAVFNAMDEKDVISWTALVAAYAGNGYLQEAMSVFRQMQLQGVKPNRITFLEVVGGSICIDHADELHSLVDEAGYCCETPMVNALLNMYAKCGYLGLARSLFQGLDLWKRNAASWTSMMSAYINLGQPRQALELFKEMMQQQQQSPDCITFTTILSACTCPSDLADAKMIHGFAARSGLDAETTVCNAMVSAYSKCNSLADACRTFAEMPHRDHVSWTSMVAAYAERSKLRRAFHLFREMQLHGFAPNDVTLITLVNACACFGFPVLDQGRLLHRYATQNGLLDFSPMLATGLITMYGKSGCLDEALTMFDSLGCKDLVSWTALVACYALNGHAHRACSSFQRMQQEGHRPSSATFVSIVTACSHAGLVDAGCSFFTAMVKDHLVVPKEEHFCSAVDLFGRSGKLEEAEYLVDRVPPEPPPSVWMAFLAACKTHGDIVRGQKAAAHILGLDSNTAATIVALSSSYAASGSSIGDPESLKQLIADAAGVQLKLKPHDVDSPRE